MMIDFDRISADFSRFRSILHDFFQFRQIWIRFSSILIDFCRFRMISEDFNRLLEYAKGLEGTIQAFRKKVEVYEAMQMQLLDDKRELKSYVSSLENTLNQARQSTQS